MNIFGVPLLTWVWIVLGLMAFYRITNLIELAIIGKAAYDQKCLDIEEGRS
jgi:hypothetical protein